MNINVLYELRDRLVSSAVAGISLIPEDFRLARAVEQVEPLAAASPAFKKIHTMAQSLLSPDCGDRGGVLLDTLALLDAVLCTQGVTGVAGEVDPLEPVGGGAILDIPHSLLSPLMEALQGTGGGRQAVIEDAHRLHPEIFGDFRLQRALVDALGDGYSEIAQTVQQWLIEGGKSIIPLLKDGFDPKVKKGMARRVKVISKLAGAEENDFYRSIAEKGDKDVRAAAIMALGYDKSNEEYLLQLLQTEKAGATKQAAQFALAQMPNRAETIAYWDKELGKKPRELVKFLRLSSEPALSDLIARKLSHAIDTILERGEQGDWVLSVEDYNHLSALLDMTLGKDTAAMCEVYRKAAKEREKLNQIQKAPKKKEDKDNAVDTTCFTPRCLSGHGKLGDLFPTLLLDAIMPKKSPVLIALAQELYRDYGPIWASPAMAAAFISWPADCSVYDKFAPLLEKDGLLDRLFGKDNMLARRDLLGVLGLIRRQKGSVSLCARLDQQPQQGYYYTTGVAVPDYLNDFSLNVSYPLTSEFDSRWIPLLVSMNWKPDADIYVIPDPNSYYRMWGDLDTLLENLMDPENPENLAILGQYFYNRALTVKDNRRYYSVLQACGWKEYRGLVVRYAEKNGADLWYTRRHLEDLPLSNEEKAQEVEAISKLVREKKIKTRNWNTEQAEKWCAVLRQGQ